MSNYKITKMQLIKEVNNSMCHNYYYLVNFRLFNEDNTRYKKGKFVVLFDIFDLQEYYIDEDEKLRAITQEEIKQYASEIAVNTLESYYRDYNNTSDLYEYCNNTIEDYNKING